MKALIAVLPGDGIGPEVTHSAREILNAVAGQTGHEFSYAEEAIGGAAIDSTGNPLPEKTLEACRNLSLIHI